MLRRIFEPKTVKIMGGGEQKGLHNEELFNFCSSSDIVTVNEHGMGGTGSAHGRDLKCIGEDRTLVRRSVVGAVRP